MTLSAPPGGSTGLRSRLSTITRHMQPHRSSPPITRRLHCWSSMVMAARSARPTLAMKSRLSRLVRPEIGHWICIPSRRASKRRPLVVGGGAVFEEISPPPAGWGEAGGGKKGGLAVLGTPARLYELAQFIHIGSQGEF